MFFLIIFVLFLTRILYVYRYRTIYHFYNPVNKAEGIIRDWNNKINKNDWELNLSNLGLTYIPLYDIVKEAQYLNISKNNLTELPDLPNVLSLNCDYNKLKMLSSLPLCETLDCNHNLLTELPDLPECLHLYCSHNPITELPNLPNCYELTCSYTKISYLPDLPKHEFINCNKTNLLIFPRVNNIKLTQVRIKGEMIGIYDKENYENHTNYVGRVVDYIFFDNDYLYISELQAKLYHLKPTRNYYRSSKIILKAWTKYKHKKIMKNLFNSNLINIVCKYLV
jgi:hypothetical protein